MDSSLKIVPLFEKDIKKPIYDQNFEKIEEYDFTSFELVLQLFYSEEKEKRASGNLGHENY